MKKTLLLSGIEVANHFYNSVPERIQSLLNKNIKPGLAVILIGSNPASKIYVRKKSEKFKELGILSETFSLPEKIQQNELLELIDSLNKDSRFTGILLQLPLPKHLDSNYLLNKIDPKKDVDGFHPENMGLLFSGNPRFIPCTPKGIIKILEYYNIITEQLHSVVIGRSNIVGKPIASLLSSRSDKGNSTVTICHSKTSNLSYFTQQADILIAAVGIPQKIKANMVKKSAIIIDVGINRDKNGKIVGDVDIDSVIDKVGAITPVPGGVGPMTIAMLVENTIESAEKLL